MASVPCAIPVSTPLAWTDTPDRPGEPGEASLRNGRYKARREGSGHNDCVSLDVRQERTREQSVAHQALYQRRLRIDHSHRRVTRCRRVNDRSRLWQGASALW